MLRQYITALLCIFILFIETSTSFAAHHCEHIKLQVLGAGGPEINDGLASSSYLVWINNIARILVDAGGGSSYNFEKSTANFNDLQIILLSHLHVDHSAAIPVYLKAGYFTRRDTSLPLLGPQAGGNFPSTENFIGALIDDRQASVYPYLSDNLYQQVSTDFLIVPRSISADDTIFHQKLTDDLTIKSIMVKHGSIPALAWRVESGSCSITFSGDMNGSSGNLQKLAYRTDLLVAHNAIPEHASPIAKRLHMTPTKIAEIARQAQVKKLLLSHFMLRTINRKTQTRKIIRQQYDAEIIVARELMFVPL